MHGTRAAGNRIAGWMDANDAHDMPDGNAHQFSMAQRTTVASPGPTAESIDIGKALRTAASKPGAFAEARVVAECTV
jgi:hypothetical protein